MTFTLQETLFSAALAVYMTASVFVAAVRWGHRCQPYGKHMDYYHPAWKTVIFCYLSNLLMAPALFMPTEPDALLQLRLLLILASPFFCAVLLFSYFGRMLGVENWRHPTYALAVPFGIMALSATVLALIPGTQMTPAFCRWFFSVAGILAIAFLACFVTAVFMVARVLQRQSEENCSNPEDFPHRYASRVIWMPLAHLGISWAVAFIGTPRSISLGVLALSVFSLVLLISILSPHRALPVEELETVDDAPAQRAQDEAVLPESRQDDIERAIRSMVEDQQAYLDSHLLLSDVASSIGVNVKYVSLVMQSRLGGFFSYVNHCRLAHAARLQVTHPDMPIGEVIVDSGFGSRTTYYKIRKQLEN